MRGPIRTNFWSCVVVAIALVVIVGSPPIRILQARDARVSTPLLSWNLARAPHVPGHAFTSISPGRTSDDAEGFDEEEEEEDESFWSSYHLVCPTSLPPGSGLKLLAEPRPGNSPPRAAALPLRC